MNYNKFIVFILFLIFLTLNCSQDKILQRATSDYFPLEPGWYWRYTIGNDTSMVQVISDTFAYGHYCVLTNRDFLEEYWIKEKNEIKKLFEKKINRAGSDFILEQHYRLYFELPLILGNSWSEDFCDTIDVLGESIIFQHQIKGSVEAIDSISTPAGDFSDVYKMMLVQNFQQNDSVKSETSYYWLAPDIGVVKKIENDVEQILIEFSSIGSTNNSGYSKSALPPITEEKQPKETQN
ncbi:MAG: hypothetical protein OEZ20_01760 [candidate division WOR-3 bacterium]|nr:hypothetical protein [candidate division WOR-3 bacterium]